MWLDQDFMDEVHELYVPSMGCDVMAPLLYSLLRFVRARTVLEAGMGYTTPFIAKALKDNDACFRSERSGMVEKTATYIQDIDALGPEARNPERGPERRALPAIYEPKTSRLADRRTEWMFSEPSALLQPGFYLEEPSSQLHCVDDLATHVSSAHLVGSTMSRLGLSDFVTEHHGDFWSFDLSALGPDVLFDVIWLDVPVSVRNVISLLRGPHWDLLNPDGGLLIIHDMLTHEGGQILVRDFFKADQQKRFGDFELVGLLEPQRVVQNSFIMLRKLTSYTERRYEKDFTAPDDSRFEADARRLLFGG